MTPEEDEYFCELMLKSQNGDEGAYTVLLKECSAFLERYFKRRLWDFTHVQELVQESLISIHKSRHTFLPGSKFYPWFYAIAHYRYVDFVRKNKVREMPVAEENRETSVELDFDLEGSLDTLEKRDKEILLLVKVEGLSVREASQKFGLSEANVKVIVHRSLKKLKEQLKGIINEKN